METFLANGNLAHRVVTFPSSPTATFPITARTFCHNPVAPSNVSLNASSPRPYFTTRSKKSPPFLMFFFSLLGTFLSDTGSDEGRSLECIARGAIMVASGLKNSRLLKKKNK
jgi:hypothetical protein